MACMHANASAMHIDIEMHAWHVKTMHGGGVGGGHSHGQVEKNQIKIDTKIYN